MTIWLLALLLAASLAGLGYRQGVIRVGFSFLGILFGAGLSGPLSGIPKHLLMFVGVKNPVLLWALPPLIVFVVVLMIFKAAGFAVHQKVDVHYKYRAGDLKLAFWERLSRRLGMCLAMANFAAYFVLICLAIYSLSYWTYQLASGDQDPAWMRFLNRLGKDLQVSGLNRVAKAVDSKSRTYYDMADFTGVVYANSLVEARLLLYPAFLTLTERPEFQDIANDKDFTEMWQRHDPIMNFFNHAKIQTILKNPDLLALIWTTAAPDLTDLEEFLKTGKSAKYASEPLLGRWDFDVNAALAGVRKTKPNIAWSEMQKLKQWMVSTYSKTSLVAMSDHKVIMKNVPPLGQTAASGAGLQTLQGQWTSVDGKYTISVSSGATTQDLAATIDGDRLTIKGSGMDMVFERQD
jgi:hypothetical protein